MQFRTRSCTARTNCQGNNRETRVSQVVNQILLELFHQLTHFTRGRRRQSASPLSNSQTKMTWDTKFGIRVGVHQNFLERLIWSWKRPQRDARAKFSINDVIGDSNFEHIGCF